MLFRSIAMQLLEHPAGIAAQGADVKLHGYISGGILFSQEGEDISLETAAVIRGERRTRHPPFENFLCFLISGRGEERALQAVVGKQAAAFPDKIIQAGNEGLL